MRTAQLVAGICVVLSVTFAVWSLSQNCDSLPDKSVAPVAAPPLDVAAFVKLLRADPQRVQGDYFERGIRVRLEGVIVSSGHRGFEERVHDVSFRLLDNDVYVVCRFVGRDAAQLAAGNYQGKWLALSGEIGGVPAGGLATNELHPSLDKHEVREQLERVVQGHLDAPVRVPDFVLHRCRVISLED